VVWKPFYRVPGETKVLTVFSETFSKRVLKVSKSLTARFARGIHFRHILFKQHTNRWYQYAHHQIRVSDTTFPNFISIMLKKF
jgi:hypothetical protein